MTFFLSKYHFRVQEAALLITCQKSVFVWFCTVETQLIERH